MERRTPRNPEETWTSEFGVLGRMVYGWARSHLPGAMLAWLFLNSNGAKKLAG